MKLVSIVFLDFFCCKTFQANLTHHTSSKVISQRGTYISLVKNKLIKKMLINTSSKFNWRMKWKPNVAFHFKTDKNSCHLKNNLRFQNNNQTVTRWILYEIDSFWIKHVSVCILFVFEYYVSKIFKFPNAKLILDKSFIWSNEIIRHCLDNRDVEPTIVGMFSFKIPKIFFLLTPHSKSK